MVLSFTESVYPIPQLEDYIVNELSVEKNVSIENQPKLIIRFLRGIGVIMVDAVKAVFKLFSLFYVIISLFTKKYITTVNEFTAASSLSGRYHILFRYRPIRYMVRFFLWCFVPVVAPIVPFGMIVTVIASMVMVDQMTTPTFVVDQKFITLAKELDASGPTLNEVGNALFAASYHQMVREMDPKELVFGWTPNDVVGLQFFDNPVNRKLGVLHASRELLTVLSVSISKLGSVDEENALLLKARQEGFAFEPYSWMFPASEDRYQDGIKLIKQFQHDLLDGTTNGATINITNKDVEAILLAISNKVLEVPHGRLTSRNDVVPWSELDDRVFFAQGAAIVARDVLTVLRHAFNEKITESGAIKNMDKAIDSLEGAINFHPWWITRGDRDAMWGDHRSKMSRYYNEARERINDVAEAINR